jgi:hypothetical protein
MLSMIVSLTFPNSLVGTLSNTTENCCNQAVTRFDLRGDVVPPVDADTFRHSASTREADATKAVDIEVPTLGPAQDPLGIQTAATEFPCGGLRPVSRTATTDGTAHAYAIPIGTRMENPAWKVDKVCTKSGWLAQPKRRVVDFTK